MGTHALNARRSAGSPLIARRIMPDSSGRAARNCPMPDGLQDLIETSLKSMPSGPWSSAPNLTLTMPCSSSSPEELSHTTGPGPAIGGGATFIPT